VDIKQLPVIQIYNNLQKEYQKRDELKTEKENLLRKNDKK